MKMLVIATFLKDAGIAIEYLIVVFILPFNPLLRRAGFLCQKLDTPWETNKYPHFSMQVRSSHWFVFVIGEKGVYVCL